MQGQIAKRFLRTAGTALGSYLDDAFRLGGNVGQNLATTALKAGKAKFAPQLVGKTGSEVPMLLREGSKSAIPTAGKLLGQGTVLGTGLAAAGMLDQQSEYSQPMSSQLGNAEMQNFLMSQQLQNQKFMHDMALIQTRAESRIPGAQYAGSLNPMSGDRAFEKSLLDEVGVFGRGIYGTGTRL
tara:strand:- start:361 stop:909 length:549 start_codon:yes stop_codon:yes gene_type:complete